MAKEKNKTQSNSRTPIIAVMGHVDHGKTSILDAIRETKVQAGEVGGITQNTRAHVVEKDSKRFTFIDTPGHEAFSGMRSRGAKVTDIVLLVVAADDGVQPQTIESIKFAQEAKVPIVVAVNKMDLPGANPDKVKQELSQYDVLVEEYGGDALLVEVSAQKKEGLDELLDTLALQAEILELKASEIKEGVAAGVVLESNLDSSLGPVSMVLIKAGKIEDGNFVVSNLGASKIRKVLNENQKPVENASEGDPVWLIGLDDVLPTGEPIHVFEKEKEAKDKYKAVEKGEDQVEDIETEEDEEEIAQEDLLAMLLQGEQEEEEIKKLNIVVKADTQGTLEAVIEQLEELSDDEAAVNIIEKGTGNVTLKDVEMASSARAIVIAFRVDIPNEVKKIAKRDRILHRKYDLIYDLIDEVGLALDSMLEPIEEEVEIARAHVKQVFVLSNKQRVSGSEVTKGIVLKGYSVYVERGGEEVGRGKITSLKQNKNEVKEVKKRTRMWYFN